MSYAKIEINIYENCDADGNGGQLVDGVDTIMPLVLWQLVQEASADAMNWLPEVVNPDYDATKAISANNPKTIPNPDSKARTWALLCRKRTETVVANYKKRMDLAPVLSNNQEEIQTFINSLNIKNKVIE